MKWFSVLSLSTVFALAGASISGGAMAQQRVTGDQLVGMWTLVTCTDANGGTRAICANTRGRMMLDATGQYMTLGGPPGRPKCSGACGRAQLSGDQYKAIAQNFVANSGSWSFNEADQTLTTTVEVSLFPGQEGRVSKDKVSLLGDEMRNVREAGAGAPVGATDIWRRVR
jgi:hypothetical protein